MINRDHFLTFDEMDCRPDDSRMLVALGEIYTRLERFNDAQKCFLKAYKVGDVEGTALMLLGGYGYENKIFSNVLLHI